jgi:hypothetical protein
MASKTVVHLEDDIDGGDATETVTFGLDGVSYEIDLNDKNAAELRKALELHVGAARRVGGHKARGVPTPARLRRTRARQGPARPDPRLGRRRCPRRPKIFERR